jgi:subtilisin family serine protease
MRLILRKELPTIIGIVISMAFLSWFAISEASSTPARFIVTFEHAPDSHAVQALERAGAQVYRNLPLVNGEVVYASEAAANGLKKAPGVKAVEKDVRAYALKSRDKCSPWPDCKNSGGGGTTLPPSPSQETPWGVHRIGADASWGTGEGSGVNVAIIDTGINKTHEDLSANIRGGINFVAPDSGPPWKRVANSDAWNDDNGHGTHVAGIVAAEDNSIGVVGVAPQASLYAVKALDSSGSGYVSDIISGIDWAISNHMNVINMSLGCDCNVSALHDAVNAAYNSGIVVVAAAGNSGDGNASTDDVIYPARYSSVIAVAATAQGDTTPTWSSEGSEVEVAAPGVNINSTWNDGGYNTESGTSMASPHVAGTVALMLATPIPAAYDVNGDSQWEPSEVREALNTTADDLGVSGQDNFSGYGLVDADEVVTGTDTD